MEIILERGRLESKYVKKDCVKGENDFRYLIEQKLILVKGLQVFVFIIYI